MKHEKGGGRHLDSVATPPAASAVHADRAQTDARRWRLVFYAVAAGYLLVTILAWQLGYLRDPGRRITGMDSVYYYVYLPSVFFDGDLDFTNNLERLYHPGYKSKLTPIGLPENQFSVGPAILWAPLYGLAHLATLLARLFGAALPADGYGPLYMGFVYVGNSLYAVLGVVLTALFLKPFFRPAAVGLACVAIMLASQLTYYFWSFTAMSHNTSFAMAALFFLLWRRKGVHPATALAAALMFLARWQNLLLLAPLVISSAADLVGAFKGEGPAPAAWVKRHTLFALVFLAGVSPQLAAWWILYGSPVTIPQGSGFISFGDIKLWPVLFGANHGLFTWHPLLLAGVAGLVLFWRRNRVLAAGLLAAFACQALMNAVVYDPSASWSFGHRRFISLLPVFAFGLACLVDGLGRLNRGALAAAGAVVLALAVWNEAFIFQYHRGIITRCGELSFRELVTDKFRLGALAHARALNLAAFKALQTRDLAAFDAAAKGAYELSPPHWRADILYALAALVHNRPEEGLEALSRWHESEPPALLPRWAMAELYARQGDYPAAARLFRPDDPSEAPDLDAEIRARIEARAKSVLDVRFYRRYQALIMKVIYLRS